MFEIPGMPGASVGAINLGDMLGKAFGGGRPKSRRTTVREAYEPLVGEESDKLLDQDAIVQEAIRQVENNGIVFLDEIDKICARWRAAASAATCRAKACSATSCR